MGKDGRYEKKTVRKSRMIALVIICAVVMSVLGVVAFASSNVNHMLDEINHVEVEKVAYTQAAEEGIVLQVEETEVPATAETETTELSNREDFVNYLIVCRPAWDNAEGWLTDTMILCTLNTRTKTLTMTSLLKDAYVEAPEYKGVAAKNMKLNAVYGMGSVYGNGKSGSMEYMNQAVYHNFGVEVDHNIELDMELFAKLVKRLDGVKIVLSQEEAKYLSEKTRTDIQPGEQTMDGTLALAYVNMWSDEEESGVSGISGQRKLVEAILQDLRVEYVGDLKKIVEEMLPWVTTSMTRDEIKECLLTILPLLRDLSIEKGGSCPAVFEKQIITTEQNKEQEVLTFDVAQTTKAMRALTLGEK